MNNLLGLALQGLPLASRSDAYPVFLSVWGALINGALTPVRGRRFFTAMACRDGWHRLFPGWGGADRGSLSPLQALLIAVAAVSQMPAVLGTGHVSLLMETS